MKTLTNTFFYILSALHRFNWIAIWVWSTIALTSFTLAVMVFKTVLSYI